MNFNRKKVIWLKDKEISTEILLRKICSELRSECIKWKVNITGHGPKIARQQILIYLSLALCGWSKEPCQPENKTALATEDHQEFNDMQIYTITNLNNGERTACWENQILDQA